MKIKDYMSRLSVTENSKEYLGSLSETIDEFEEDDYKNIWGKRTKEQEEIYNNWSEKLGDLVLDGTPFADASFLKTFLEDIPEEDQFKYVYNTVLYGYGKNNYDPKYVLFTRRAMPSIEAKPEQFWTREYRVPFLGLRYEIPYDSPHRFHSVIMVTTLECLYKYGLAVNFSGASDGELMINYVPFSRDDILFVHKSNKEKMDLVIYLKNGGMKHEEVLDILKLGAQERQDHYNAGRKK